MTPSLRHPWAQALEVLRKLAASSDANLAALQAAGALAVLLELLQDMPPPSGRTAGAMHLLRDIALYAPASRCGHLRRCLQNTGGGALHVTLTAGCACC